MHDKMSTFFNFIDKNNQCRCKVSLLRSGIPIFIDNGESEADDHGEFDAHLQVH